MAKKIEFEATMNVDDVFKSLEGLEKKSEQTLKRIQSLSGKQTQKIQEASDLKLRADDSINKQAYYKQLAQTTSGTQKKQYQSEANLWAEDARAATAGAKEAEKAAASASKEIEKEIAEYNRLAEAISSCRDRVAELANEEAQSGADARNEAIQQRKDSIRGTLQNMFTGLGTGVGNIYEGIYNGATKAGSALLGILSNGLKKVGSLAMSAARSGIQALWNGLQKIGSMAVNAARSLGGALINGLKSIASAALNAGKSLLGLNKRHKTFGDGLKGGFMTILKYAFGIRSLYFLFRKLRTALTDSIKTLAQHDAETASSIQGLSASLNTLKASFGAAFAPVINAVAPILIRLIDLCTRAANAVGALFAALMGGKTFKVAAASADNLASSTGGAAKQAKELKKQLAGFDELEILSEDKDSDSGSGGGGSGGGVTYEDMEIPDWAKKIKEMIDNAQWEELADMLTAKLNDMVNSVDWAGIGSTIGYWMNAVLTFLARALTGFDWYNLGGKLADMLNHVMYEVDWENLGKILVGKLYIMLESVAGFLDEFDWEYFTRSLYDVIRGAVLGIDWVQVASDFVDGLSDMFGGISDGLDNIEWADFGNELTKGYQRAIEDINWEDLGNSISYFLHAALTSATKLVASIEPTVMAENFRVFLSGVFGSINWVQLMEDFLGFLTTLINNASSFITSLGFGQMAKGLSELISNALSSTSWGELASSFSNFFHTMITNAVTFLKNLDVKSIGESFMTFLRSIFDNIDFVQLANDIKDLIVTACEKATELIKTLGSAEGGYKQMGSDLWTWLSDTFKQIDWASLAESIFLLLGTAIRAASDFIGQFIYDAVSSIFDFFSQFVKDKDGDGKITGGEILAGILEGIVEGVKSIGEWIKEHVWTPFITGLKSAFGIHSPAETMKEPGQMIGEGLLEGIGKIFEAIGDWIKEHIFDPIVQGAKDGIAAIKEVFNGVGETVGSAIDSGKDFVKNTWDNFLGMFSDQKPDVYPTKEAEEFKEASDRLNTTLSEEKTTSVDAKGAYQELSSTIESLKGKTNLTREEMELLLQSQRLLADLTAEYGDELERQGSVVDSNAQSVQNAASAVSEEARAVSDASAETQELNRALNDSSTVYSNASTTATQYGTQMDTASAKSESSAQKVEASAEKIQESMVEAADATADTVTRDWDEIESRTSSFSDTMSNALTGVISAINEFSDTIAMRLPECVNTVVMAVNEMVTAWNTDWGTPHFHMPLFSMSGVFDLQTGQAPQVVISGWTWLAKGGIVDGATLIGAGEAGKEAIVPLERNTEWIDMVASGLIERLSSNKYANRLAEAFSSVPMPAMANGSIVPPNAFSTSFGGNMGDSLLEELKALRSEISALASQPIQVSSNLYMDRREVGRSVTEYQRSEARVRG